MKQLLLCLFIITLSLFLGGCNKKDKDAAASIVGTWELRRTSAAMNPTDIVYPPGNGNVLKFTSNKYEIYKNHQLFKSGHYATVRDLTVKENVCLTFAADRYRNRIIYDDITSTPKEFFEISSGKLTFISGCYAVDAGHTSEYEKLND